MISRIFIFLIDLYRVLVSPLFPQTCRFYPSCSNYARDAFTTYGVVKGLFLTLKRLVKCHPFHPGGLDPLPETKPQD